MRYDARMSDMKDKLRELEREVKASQSEREPLATRETQELLGRKKRPIRTTTKRKVLIGAALALTFLLVWKKVQINFVVFTSFWGFLGIVLFVFVLLYGVLHFFFDSSDSSNE